jgi:hypothetical protein
MPHFFNCSLLYCYKSFTKSNTREIQPIQLLATVTSNKTINRAIAILEELTMNPFTHHTQQQGVTYLEHGRFALGIAYRLFISVIAFVAHAVFPFVPIKPEHDLEATMAYLDEQNNWIESAKRVNRLKASSDFIPANQGELGI